MEEEVKRQQKAINNEDTTDDIKDLRLRAFLEESPELKKLYREEYERVKASKR